MKITYKSLRFIIVSLLLIFMSFLAGCPDESSPTNGGGVITPPGLQITALPEIQISPSEPTSCDDLVCSIVSEGSCSSGRMTYDFQWYKNNQVQSGLTESQISSVHISGGEVWRCEVTPKCGSVSGDNVSVEVIIASSLAVEALDITGNWGDMALTPDGARLYVIERGVGGPNNEDSVTVIETETHTEIASIPLGPGFFMQIVPRGDRAYISCSNGMGGGIITPGQNCVKVIGTDPQNQAEYNQVIATVSTGGDDYGTWGLTVSSDGTRAYAVHRNDARIDIIDTESLEVIDFLSLAPKELVYDITTNSDGTKLYPVSWTGILWEFAIDQTMGELQEVRRIQIDLGYDRGAYYIDISPDDSKAYVASSEGARIAVVDLENDFAVSIIDTTLGEGETPSVLREFVVFPGDIGTLALATNLTTSVLVIDVDSKAELGSIEIGHATFNVVYARNLVNCVLAYVNGGGKITIIRSEALD
jgi:YVTN family beta-propeller protein